MTVGIVGAGITGLALTHHCAERGVDSVAFEAGSEPGGVIRSETVDGRVLDVGPQRTRLTDGIEELATAAGVTDDLLVADDDLPLYVYADGRLGRVPRSLREFVATDLLSWRGKLRVLREPWTEPGRPDESAAALFARKFGREAYENVVGPLFGGIYGSDPARMPARHALSKLLALEEREGNLLRPALRRARSGGETPPPVSFREGMQQLPKGVADAHPDRVRLSTPVESVRTAGDRYVLATGDGETAVDRVVFTTPADVTADLLGGLAPDAARSLRALNYNRLALVHLRADADREGFGYQVRHDEPLRTLGVSWNASLFDRDGVYTAFLGGMRHPELLDEPESRLGRIAAEEFEAVMGVEADALRVTKLPRGFPAWDETWAALDEFEVPDDVHLATNYTARMGLPGRVREAKRLAAAFADDAADGDAATRPATA